MSLQANRYSRPRSRTSRNRRSSSEVAFICRAAAASRRQPPSADVEALAVALTGLGIKCDYEPLRWTVQLPGGRVTGFQVDLVLWDLDLVIEVTGRNRLAGKLRKIASLNAQQHRYRAILIRSEEAVNLAANPMLLLDQLYASVPQEKWGVLHMAFDRVPVAA